MAQAVSRRPSTADAQVRSRVSLCGICGGQSGTGTGFSASSSVFPCQFHSTDAPLLGKGKGQKGHQTGYIEGIRNSDISDTVFCYVATELGFNNVYFTRYLQ
jgi:hypothetical protein